MKNLSLVLCLATISGATLAQDLNDGAFLDSKYKNLVHPIKSSLTIKGLPVSNTAEVIAYQTPVRSQMARGTCSIFSATAYLEGLLVKKGKFDTTLDLSEEWLQYTSVRNKTSDGSTAWSNFPAIRDYGMPSESTLPYIGEDWTEVANPLKDTRCGKLLGGYQTSCYIVHRDPSLLNLLDVQIDTLYGDKEFIAARKESLDFKKANIKFANSNYVVSTVADVKASLQKGTPVVLELDFHYGAWNHRLADELGIGRNMEHWYKGIIAYPEVGSMDIQETAKKPAGHSVLVVGYDDNKIVVKTILMADGTSKKFTYKGVYYIKNSWGSANFGRDFEIGGVKAPGYGMIVQKYAEDYGQFFQMPLL